MEAPRNENAEAAKVSAIDKPSFGIEAGGNILVHGIEFHAARAALRKHLIRRPGLVRAVLKLGLSTARTFAASAISLRGSSILNANSWLRTRQIFFS
jgi:hypothetical protein